MRKETEDTAGCLSPDSTTRLTQLELAWLELTCKSGHRKKWKAKKRRRKIIKIYVLPSFLAIQSLRQPASVSLSAGFVVYSKDVSLANASSPVINNKWDGVFSLRKAKLGYPTLSLEIFNSQRRGNIFSFSKISHTFRHFC